MGGQMQKQVVYLALGDELRMTARTNTIRIAFDAEPFGVPDFTVSDALKAREEEIAVLKQQLRHFQEELEETPYF